MAEPASASIRGHAALDLTTRRLKARKVVELLGLDATATALNVLEVGCGSGAIAHYVASLPAAHHVEAVDVFDSRVVRDGYHFQIVSGTELPFGEETFDVVISNHVIEHVGVREVQTSHLAEIRRVLKRSGTSYLATPNRWRAIEPHYSLPFLSVLPVRLRSPYLRRLQHVDYDCFPLSSGELEALFRTSGLTFRRLGAQAFKLTLELESPDGRFTELATKLPDKVVNRLQTMMPTLVYGLGREIMESD